MKTHALSKLLDIPAMDPDDARRRKLLNILLLGMAALGILGLLAAIVTSILDIEDPERLGVLLLSTLIWLAGSAVIYAINRYLSGWLSSSLFLVLLTLLVAQTDVPEEVVDGRSVVPFAIPILMASFLLRPYASFLAAGLNSLLLLGIALREQIDFSPYVAVAFFVIALMSWLAANGLERALKDLRLLNLELDQRVRDRTRELAESLSKTEAILESTADGIIVFDNNGTATVANPAVSGLLARPADGIVGRDIETLMGDVVDTERERAIAELLRQGEMPYPSIKFDWDTRTLSVSAAPVHLASGEEIGTVAVFRDFTREAELDRMKSAFVSTASHELRTPLSAILGYADMLQEGIYGELSERQRNTMERIVANIGRLLSLVGNLLDQAQMEAGMMTLDVAPFKTADLISDAMAVMSVLAEAKGLELSSRTADDVPDTLVGDRQRLHQILVNLVSNAVKFTQEGTVSVRAYRPDASRWALAVSDTGPGISKEAQSYIFEPFRHADESLTREYTGAGLGLTIVKQLVELMGGEINLESDVGVGSTFTIVLPIEPTGENLSLSRSAVGSGPGSTAGQYR
jgi:PAS domain S-box-containing protein